MLTLIAYDLKSPDKDYKSLYDAIKGLGDKWWLRDVDDVIGMRSNVLIAFRRKSTRMIICLLLTSQINNVKVGYHLKHGNG